MPRLKRPHVAVLPEVRITREGEYAIIEYLDPTVATTHFKLGPEIANLSEQEILDHFNETIEARDRLMASYNHVAVEIPKGSPQIEYFAPGDQWVPRGDVLRCVVSDGGPNAEATVEIDERELSLAEFGRLLLTHAGWGMRICFVPDNALEDEPEIEVREPEDEEPN